MKKRMKALLAIGLSAIIMVCSAGCGNGKEHMKAETDPDIPVEDVAFPLKEKAELWNRHAGTFKTVDALKPVDMFLCVDSLPGRIFFYKWKQTLTFIIAKGRSRKRKKFRYFPNCISMHNKKTSLTSSILEVLFFCKGKIIVTVHR